MKEKDGRDEETGDREIGYGLCRLRIRNKK
jgi:hypothetical protein